MKENSDGYTTIIGTRTPCNWTAVLLLRRRRSEEEEEQINPV